MVVWRPGRPIRSSIRAPGPQFGRHSFAPCRPVPFSASDQGFMRQPPRSDAALCRLMSPQLPEKLPEPSLHGTCTWSDDRPRNRPNCSAPATLRSALCRSSASTPVQRLGAVEGPDFVCAQPLLHRPARLLDADGEQRALRGEVWPPRESNDGPLVRSLVPMLPPPAAKSRHPGSDEGFLVSGAPLVPPPPAPCCRNGRQNGRHGVGRRVAGARAHARLLRRSQLPVGWWRHRIWPRHPTSACWSACCWPSRALHMDQPS
jgi:hypothetical protein